MDMPIQQPDAKWRVPRSPLLWSLFAVLCLAIATAQMLNPALPGIQKSDVWISEVKRGDFVRKVRGVGVLVPAEVRWIAAASAGRVERVLIKPGASVRADTVIAELSNPELINQLERAQWELDAAEANLLALQAQLEEQTLEHELRVTKAQMALETARLKEKAERPLAEKSIISALDFETTKLNTSQRATELQIRQQAQLRAKDVEQAKLVAEQANVRRYKNLVEHFETQIAALEVTADIDGVLQEISVDVGQRLEVGSNIALVAEPDSLLAELQVQENLVQDLRLDLSVTIDTRNGLVEGRVRRIDPRVQNGNVQIDVELFGTLPDSARPDLSVTGTIVAEKLKDAVYIDRPAGVAALSDKRLFTLASDQQTAQQRNVKFGKASVSSIQILAGLEPGDSVIVSDMSELNPHDTIRILQ